VDLKEFAMRHPAVTALILVLSCAASAARAGDDETLFNRVYLSAQAEREIPNDEMRVVMEATSQGKQPDAVADKVNTDMAWGLEQAKKYKDVTSATEAYNTWPIYDDRLIVGWRASQQLVLRGENVKKLTELVGVLQSSLQVSGMSFSPTTAARDRIVDELIDEAMEAFKKRIGIIGAHMDDRNYRIVDLHVETGESFAQPRPFMARAAMMEKAVAPPAVEAGTSTVTVTVNGSVQFF
jgi:predicted secreted protein